VSEIAAISSASPRFCASSRFSRASGTDRACDSSIAARPFPFGFGGGESKVESAGGSAFRRSEHHNSGGGANNVGDVI
jgi:hypothetical protein